MAMVLCDNSRIVTTANTKHEMILGKSNLVAEPHEIIYAHSGNYCINPDGSREPVSYVVRYKEKSN